MEVEAEARCIIMKARHGVQIGVLEAARGHQAEPAASMLAAPCHFCAFSRLLLPLRAEAKPLVDIRKWPVCFCMNIS